MREEAVDAHVLLVLGGLRLRLLLGVADDEAEPLEERDVFGETARLDGAARRVSSICARATSGDGEMMNAASALRAANARPGPDEPAWNSTGVRCGDGDGRCGPSTR